MNWYEVRLRRGAKPAEFYASLKGKVAHVHHFWDEPWWPDGYVVRVASIEPIADPDWWFWTWCKGVDHAIEWDASDDEKLYGEDWPWVMDLFQASSRLAAAGEPEDQTLKLVHCLLNARHMDVPDERRFARRLYWNRLLINHRIRRYNRRVSRRAQSSQKAVAA